MDLDQISNDLRRLKAQAHTATWASEIMDISHRIWTDLLSARRSDTRAVAACAEHFADLLLDQDAFDVARMVIPDFRSASTTASIHPPLKALILSKLARPINQASVRFEPLEARLSDPLYLEEKSVFHRAELERAGDIMAAHYQEDSANTSAWLRRYLDTNIGLR